MMMVDTPGDASSRFEKSLGLLTTKFVTLLQEADGGILDLKVVRKFENFQWSIFEKNKRSTFTILTTIVIVIFLGCRYIKCETETTDI